MTQYLAVAGAAAAVELERDPQLSSELADGVPGLRLQTLTAADSQAPAVKQLENGAIPARIEGPSWWARAVASYIRFRRAEGASPHTLKTYRWALNRLGEHLARMDVTAPEQLEREHVELWNESLLDDPTVKESSRALAISNVRAFVTWAAEEGILAGRLLRGVPRVRFPRRDARPIPEEDMERLTGFFTPAPASLVGLRTRALFWVLYQTGARISEALQLRRDDFTAERRARIIGKGGREEVIEWGEMAELAVRDYFRARTDDNPAAFVTHLSPEHVHPVGQLVVNLAWARVARQLGLRPFTSHRLRHTCGTTIYRKTHDVLGVATKLRHKNLNTSMGYARVDDARRRELTSGLEPEQLPRPRPAVLKPISRRRRRAG